MRGLGIGCLLFFVCGAWAARIDSFQEVGPHERLFVLEKSENPQNLMAIYTRADSDCHLIGTPKKPSQPQIGYYWLMEGQRYKPVHSLIQAQIRNRLNLAAPAKTDKGVESFNLKLNDLKELKNDLKDPQLRVQAQKKDGHCEIAAFVQLGPSDFERILRLDSIYAESKKTFWPPFRKVVAVTLKGTDVATGESVSRKYEAR